jgi:hypothetical protein
MYFVNNGDIYYLQSEMQDSNLRPSAPKADALPSCANPGYFLATIRLLMPDIGSAPTDA